MGVAQSSLNKLGATIGTSALAISNAAGKAAEALSAVPYFPAKRVRQNPARHEPALHDTGFPQTMRRAAHTLSRMYADDRHDGRLLRRDRRRF